MTALEISELAVRFATEDGDVLAVKDVSLSVRPGEILALCGESGCGKSVTAMAVSRLLPPNARISGSVRLDGRELTGLSERELRQVRGKDVSMVFQEPMTSLNPSFTVGFQIDEVLRQHEKLSRRAARVRTVELLELVGIADPARRCREYPHQLSGGMRQRVMIAMAVACSPRVLIADEPTTALDVTIQAGVLDIFRDLADRLGTAIVLITHDLGVVAAVADQVAIMYAGRLVERAGVTELFAAPRHPYTVGLLGALPAAVSRISDGTRGRLVEIPGMLPDPRRDGDDCAFAPRCRRAEPDCAAARPALAGTGRSTVDKYSHQLACFHPEAVR
ncbi:ABC transporter ATP-binding protein [Fodinicola feengrottensis]|uniref:ABC transporter ATP-binding protein n=1 Tax=Fodinicola feengrottensis TaxID=435914 RepID=A0ABN2FTJ5_9ACTN